MEDAPRSFCIECDALPGECQHTGPRYLEAAVYAQVGGSKGPKTWIWSIKEWDLRRMTTGSGYLRESAPITHTPISLENLLALAEQEIDLSNATEQRITDAYTINPLKTSRVVEAIVEKNSKGVLRNAGGLLWVRLGEIIEKG